MHVENLNFDLPDLSIFNMHFCLLCVCVCVCVCARARMRSPEACRKQGRGGQGTGLCLGAIPSPASKKQNYLVQVENSSLESTVN